MFKRKKGKMQEGNSRIAQTFAGIGRLAHASASPFMKLYLHEKHLRVRAVILNQENEVLLVRSWFSHQKWSLPGGGIGRAETPPEAAVREVFEETGLRIAIDDLHELGSFTNPLPKAPYTVACYRVDIPKREPHIARHRRLEMLDVAWFSLSALPKDRSLLVDAALALLK